MRASPAASPTFVAFLRSINVGGHNVVRMAALVEIFESLGFSGVKTVGASGNVIFHVPARGGRRSEAHSLEQKIAAALWESLGFEVATFVRTAAELQAIAAREPFSRAAVAAAPTFNVGFLASPLDAEHLAALTARRTRVDDYRVVEREFYWLSTASQGKAALTHTALERILGQPTTMRRVEMVKKLVAGPAGVG